MSFSGSGQTRSRHSSRRGGNSHGGGYSNSRNSQRGGRRPAQRFMGKQIPHAHYVQEAVTPVEQTAYNPTHAFADFGFSPTLLENVAKRGYVTPTPIQDQAIPHLMEGRDVVGIANTGTGKTAAFLLPFMHKLLENPDQGVLILAPTRELAVQILDELKSFSENLPLSATLCIGGANIKSQISRLRENPHFVIATPGRLKDLFDRRAFQAGAFTNVILDEVDRMLDIGFRKDILFLISKLAQERQSAFFSATMTRDVEEVMRALLTDPVKVQVKNQQLGSGQVQQDIVKLKPGQSKVDVLHELLLQEEFAKVIVFGRTKHGINKLEKQLSERGLRVRAIHGNKSQNARQHSLSDFKQGRVLALLATDIASRGIDVDGVTHVINYDEPQSYEDYIHRIGRTGRAGNVGKALTFVG